MNCAVGKDFQISNEQIKKEERDEGKKTSETKTTKMFIKMCQRAFIIIVDSVDEKSGQ